LFLLIYKYIHHQSYFFTLQDLLNLKSYEIEMFCKILSMIFLILFFNHYFLMICINYFLWCFLLNLGKSEYSFYSYKSHSFFHLFFLVENCKKEKTSLEGIVSISLHGFSRLYNFTKRNRVQNETVCACNFKAVSI
jgi:hypothetical protein